MRERFMVRRLKKDVLTELPAKRRQVIVLEPGKALAKLVARESQAYKDYEPSSFLGKTQPAIGEISVTRKKIALAKVKFAVEHIKEILNEQEKVAGCLRAPLTKSSTRSKKRSRRAPYELTVVSLLMSANAAVDRFQTDENVSHFYRRHSSGGGWTNSYCGVHGCVCRRWTGFQVKYPKLKIVATVSVKKNPS